MIRKIVFFLIIVILFAAAAGSSWFLQSQQAPEPNARRGGDEKTTAPEHAPEKGKHAVAETAPKSVVRTPATPLEPDRLTQLAAALQQQQNEIKNKEQQIGLREKQMDIVHEEIQKEQKRLDTVRKEIQKELQMLENKFADLEKISAVSEKDRKEFDMMKKEEAGNKIVIEEKEWSNVQAMAKKLENMEPDAASSMLVKMVDNGKLETAVKMLSQVRDRQAAAIISEISKEDPRLPGQIFDRMLKLKKPQSPSSN